MTTSGDNKSTEPQDERGAPGSRDTGSDQPAGGPADRPSGTYQGDETVPDHSKQGDPGDTGSQKTEVPPSDVKPAVPPYEGRQTQAKPMGDRTEDQQTRSGAGVKPASDSD